MSAGEIVEEVVVHSGFAHTLHPNKDVTTEDSIDSSETETSIPEQVETIYPDSDFLDATKTRTGDQNVEATFADPVQCETNDMDDIRNVKGIGAKSEEVLRAKGINKLSELYDVIQDDSATLEVLNKEIRGFGKIVQRVKEMMSNPLQ